MSRTRVSGSGRVHGAKDSRKGNRHPSLVITVAFALAFLALAPATTSAQSGIVGVVKDTSGAVLPGVTVEAASPALIEKMRSAITDDQGRYNIVDLRPGVYSVTFTLPGFNTVKREGIELAAAFTATVNADLPVGALEETVTVSGAAPVVDIQNSSQQKQLSTQLLDAIPTGGRLPQSYTVLVPGVSQPPESNAAGLPNSFVQLDLSFHGDTRGAWYLNDGFDLSHRADGGAQLMLNEGMSQEVVVSAGASSAEQQSGGVFTSVIPKDGGNTFHGQVYAHYADESFSGDNVSPELSAVGVSAKSVRQSWDLNPVFGGPVMKDKVWFMLSYRNTGSEIDAGIRYDTNPLDWVYTPDVSRPGASEQIAGRNQTLRVTYQATPRNKFTLHWDNQPNDWYNRSIGGNTAPEASTWSPYVPQYLLQGVWKSPVSSRLLLEAGISYTNTFLSYYPNDHDAYTGGPVSPDLFAISATDLNTGIRFRGPVTGLGMLNHSQSVRWRGNASYVTGTHAFKTGIYVSRFQWAVDRVRYHTHDVSYNLRNGTPASVVLWANELFNDRTTPDLGMFVQDQWTRSRLTLNVGLRYDYYATNSPAQDLPANRWLPARHFDALTDAVKWHDISPRMGLTYDLFGTGRTALKWSLNRYIGIEGNSLNRSIVPSNAAVISATRTWNDANRNYEPDCDFTNTAANGECGVLSDLNFGRANPRATVIDPDLMKGWGKRAYNWETGATIQHELLPGFAVSAAYWRRWFGNLTVSDNLLVTPADFSPYCVTAPVDSRLPGGGGNEQCGYFDVSPAKQGQRQSFITLADNFGDGHSRLFNGVELTVSARLPGGMTVTGGTSTARVSTSVCSVVDSPQELLFCEVTPPFQTSLKLMGVYPLPWFGIQMSGSIQSLPGPEISATDYVASNAEVARTLGRNLASGANGTVTVPLMQRGTLYAERYNKVDMRFSKILRFGGRRMTGSLDVLNLFNGSGVVQITTRYGPNYLNPSQIIAARLFRISGQIDF